MLLPHMFLELVGAAIAVSFVVATARDLTVMTDTVMNVEHMTVQVGSSSESFGATVINARYSLRR
jgi:hypothetical protein